MSIQSDIEMLSIHTVETYAKRHNLTIKVARDIFQKNQVFEKIVLQHEYLHQVSMEEVMEFIEKIVDEDNEDLILFHGTDADFEKVVLGRSHNRRDFGVGFYTTLLEPQAREWAYRLSLRNRTNRYYVYQFQFEASAALKILRFESLNKEWLEFVKENRSRGGLQHDYDVVFGPVADDNTMETVQLYLSGVLTADEAVNRLRYAKVNNQISFHTEEALKYLRFVGRSEYHGRDLYI